MKPHLFAIDLDKTLVAPGESRLPDSRVQVLESFIDQNHHLVICTARTHASSLELLKGLNKPYYLISSLGAVARSVPDNKILFYDEIEKSTLEAILLKAKNQYFAISQTQLTEVSENTRIVGGSMLHAEIFLRASLKKQITLSEFIAAEPLDNNKILRMGFVAAIHDLEKLMDFSHSIALEYRNVSVGFFSDPKFEICTSTFTNYNTNKGTAIKRIAQILGVEKSHIYAFGDSDADIPMLKEAGNPFLVSDHTIMNPDFDFSIVDPPENEGLIDFMKNWMSSNTVQ